MIKKTEPESQLDQCCEPDLESPVSPTPQSEIEQGPRLKPDAKAEPESKADQTPDPLQQAVARCHHEARIVERALPAVLLGAMSAKHLGTVVTPGGYEAYLAKLIADRGQPVDALERMFIEQLAWCHCRIGGLHAQAACTETPQLNVAYTLAAARLMAEHRKTSVALKDYRRSAATSGTVPPNPADPTAHVNRHPQKQAEKNGDTKQGTEPASTEPFQAADRCTCKPGEETRLNGRGSPKASRNRPDEPALAAFNGSANGRG